MKILIIKTSSLGDIIHSFPAIEDIKKNYPESRVDFLVDGTFLSTAKLNQSIDNFFSISLRETKNQSFVKRLNNLNEEINALFKNITYDFVIDFQGLMRTQIIGSKIKKISSSKNFMGYNFRSAKEGLLTFLYDKGINVNKEEHAVMRMKKLMLLRRTSLQKRLFKQMNFFLQELQQRYYQLHMLIKIKYQTVKEDLLPRFFNQNTLITLGGRTFYSLSG